MQDTESREEPRASLSLVVDVLTLANVKSASGGGCRFCVVLTQALDAFFDGWREHRCRAEVHIKEKGTLKVRLDGAQWARQAIEIYAGSGRHRIFAKSL